MDERLTALLKIMEDENTAKKLMNMPVEDVQKELAAKGLEFSVEELTAFAQGLSDSQSTKDELSEADLVNVAGGSRQDCYNAGRRCGQALRFAFTVLAPFASGLW